MSPFNVIFLSELFGCFIFFLKMSDGSSSLFLLFFCSVSKIFSALRLIHKTTNSITFPSDITAPSVQVETCPFTVRRHSGVAAGACFGWVFACLPLAAGLTPAPARLWTLAASCTASACGVWRASFLCVSEAVWADL